jgi:hypothetical protein
MLILRHDIPINGVGIKRGRLFLLRPARSRAWLLPINTNPPAVMVAIPAALGELRKQNMC